MNPELRIAMIIHGYLPLIGGAERQLGALAPRMQQQGMEVHVLTRRVNGLPAFEVIEGVQVHRLPAPGPKLSASLIFTRAALTLLDKLRPDVIHAHELFSATTTAIAARRRWGIPVTVTAHRSGPIGDVQRLQQKLFGAQRLATFAREVDAFIVISQEIDAELAGAGVPAERRHFIPNGVDSQRFAPLAAGDKAALRSRLGLPGDAPLVVFSGRLEPEKRINHLIACWPEVRTRHANAQLLLLGSGSQERALRQSAGEGVRFIGSVDDVTPYLQAGDIFVLPSVAEGLSVALLEAMSSGLAVIATAVGGSPQLVASGANGLLIPPDDPPALRQALLDVCADEALRQAYGRAARQHILENYAITSMVTRLQAVYRQLCKREGTVL